MPGAGVSYHRIQCDRLAASGKVLIAKAGGLHETPLQSQLQVTPAVHRNHQTGCLAGLTVDVMTAVHPKQTPAACFHRLGESRP